MTPAVPNWMDHSRMVAQIARRRASRQVGFDELYSAGLWGLYQAACRFNPAINDNFEGYPIRRVTGEIIEAVREAVGRKGKVPQPRPERIGDRDFATTDKSLKTVDDRDEISHHGINPDMVLADRVPRKPLRHGLGLCEWARRIGISAAGLKQRIDRWGLDRALSTPAREYH